MKKIGYLITGLALGLTLSVASPVLAQSVKSITARLNNTVNVLVNGEKVNLNAKPITYNNLNYLPVAEISQALGLDVSYDKKTDEIRIVNPNATNVETNQSPKSTEPVVYNKELKLGESYEFNNTKLTINKLLSEPRDEKSKYYGLDYELKSISGSSDGVALFAFLKFPSGTGYYLSYGNYEKIFESSPIKASEIYKGDCSYDKELPVSVTVEITSYSSSSKTTQTIGYVTWTF